MKQRFIFVFLIFFTWKFSGIAQEGLLIQNKKKQIAWMYEVGAKVTYIKFHEEEYTRSRLNALLDSAIVLGSDTVPLKSIAGIRKKDPLHNAARVIGMPLMLAGTVLMGEGVVALYAQGSSKSVSGVLLLGAGIFALGYLPYHLERKDLEVNIGGDWVLEIYRGKQPVTL